MQVHPLAAVFPMMTDDELADLADDIKEHGLIHPIVLDADGTLVDGRNRLRACEIAGIEPTFETLNGHDAAAFIVSANLERRNLTKGQQAMALAMIYPQPDKRGRGNKGKAEETSGFSQKRLAQARSILRHSQALADDVMTKRRSLDAALDIVAEEHRASQSTDEKMAELRTDAPDIADMVDDERLSLEAGITELRTRQRRIEEAIDAAKRALARIADIPVQMAMIEKGVALAGADLLAEIDIAAIAAAISRLTTMTGGNAQ
jgi:ParB-like chromosome segregation protein Spo0J